jgi:hypothetical protein
MDAASEALFEVSRSMRIGTEEDIKRDVTFKLDDGETSQADVENEKGEQKKMAVEAPVSEMSPSSEKKDDHQKVTSTAEKYETWEDKGQDEASECDWTKKAMDSFGLNPIPSNWANPGMLEQCHLKDKVLWKRYVHSRHELEEICQDEEPDEKKCDDMDMDTTEQYTEELKREFHAKWEASVLGAVMLKHTKQRVANATFDESNMANGKLKETTVVSTIFSPYLLPRAVQLCHRYYRRTASDSANFYCTWHIQFVSLTEYEEGRDLYGYYWKPQLRQMNEICSNGHLDMPTKEIAWREVQDVDTTYFTPSLVRRIREWLFGHSHSYDLFNDMDLLRYIFGSCGAVHNFNTLHGSIGYHWKASPEVGVDMKVYGSIKDSEVEQASGIGMNWLEFQCRLASGNLRSVDLWYEPYDQRIAKAKWGGEVLTHRYEEHGYYEHDQKVREKPWKVWDRSSRGVHVDGALQNNVMGIIGKL